MKLANLALGLVFSVIIGTLLIVEYRKSRLYPYSCYGPENWSITDTDRSHVDIFNFTTRKHEMVEVRWHNGSCIGGVK